MLARLGCLFVLLPLLELAILIRIGQWIGLGPTLGLVIVTGIAGAFLARREGIRALTAVQGELAAGRLPGRSLMDGAAVLVGGAFLLTPGLLTDVAGFALLVPPSRRILYGWIRRRLERALARGDVRISVMGTGGGPPGREAGSPFGPGSRRRDDPEGDDDEPRPPRSGEIIQD